MGESNRRKSGRLVCAGLVSTLGDVPDLSAGGCRVNCRHLRPFNVGQTHQFALTGDGHQVLVEGTIVRRQRLGFMRFEYGIEFAALTPDQRAAINDLSRTTSVKRLMSTVDEAASRAA